MCIRIFCILSHVPQFGLRQCLAQLLDNLLPPLVLVGSFSNFFKLCSCFVWSGDVHGYEIDFSSKRSPLFQFEIAFSDMLIFLTPKEVGETSVFVEKKILF